jgi:type IV secretion system protein VirB8
MLRKNKPVTENVETSVKKAVGYEVTIADMARRSERRAWWVAGTSVVISLILTGGYFYMLPLKEKVPYLVMADPYTGNVAASRLVPDVLDRQITSSEAINRSNVHRFVTARESWDSDRRYADWRLPYLMGAGEVVTELRAQYQKNSPNNPANVYGQKSAVRVRILSTVLQRSRDGGYSGATVRFQRALFDKASGGTRVIDNKIATLSFTYARNLKLDDVDRVQNPLGFQVTSYRVDNDAAALPPAEVSIDPPAPVYAPAQDIAPSTASGAELVGDPPPVQAEGLTPAVPNNNNGAVQR